MSVVGWGIRVSGMVGYLESVRPNMVVRVYNMPLLMSDSTLWIAEVMNSFVRVN